MLSIVGGDGAAAATRAPEPDGAADMALALDSAAADAPAGSGHRKLSKAHQAQRLSWHGRCAVQRDDGRQTKGAGG